MFNTVLINVAIILIYMLLGFAAGKGKKALPSHAKSLSGILIYVLAPAMIINAFVNMEYSHESLAKIGIYAGASFVIQFLFMMLLYIIFRRKYSDARYRILTIGSTLGNVGFFGMPVLAGIFPTEPIVLCYSSINVVTMNLLVFTIGVFLITNDKKYMSLKSAILNPSSLSLLVSIPLFIFKVQLPELLGSPLALLAKMVTPMCMLILGIRLSAVSLKAIFTRPVVYATCFLKLVVFPFFALACVMWLPFMDNTAKLAIFILAATPSGAIIESLAEFHECEQELSANVVLLTTILCLITMPIVLLAMS